MEKKNAFVMMNALYRKQAGKLKQCFIINTNSRKCSCEILASDWLADDLVNYTS